MKKSVFVLPVLAALAVGSANERADAFDVTVSASVSTACTVTNTVAALTISGSITTTAGVLDPARDLGPTQVAQVTCTGPARVDIAADKGFFKSATDTQPCASGGSRTCIQYDAMLAIGSGSGAINAPVVNANNKNSSVNTTGALSAVPLRLNMDLIGPAVEPLAAGTYSEKFTITVTAL